MSLLPFFLWCENSGLVAAMRTSHWLYPAIQGVHLVGFGAIGGAVLVVDLRLLGVGLRRQPVAQVARDAQRWFLFSLLFMLSSGFLLFMSEASKCYYYIGFWIKMASLFLAIVFTFTVRRKVAMADETQMSPGRRKLVALVSVALWSGVGVGAKMIGFS